MEIGDSLEPLEEPQAKKGAACGAQQAWAGEEQPVSTAAIGFTCAQRQDSSWLQVEAAVREGARHSVFET